MKKDMKYEKDKRGMRKHEVGGKKKKGEGTQEMEEKKKLNRSEG